LFVIRELLVIREASSLLIAPIRLIVFVVCVVGSSLKGKNEVVVVVIVVVVVHRRAFLILLATQRGTLMC
jgi:hypothetical protein